MSQHELDALIADRSVMACQFDANGKVILRCGDFLGDWVTEGDVITERCEFMFGVIDSMEEGDHLKLEGMHFSPAALAASEDSFIIDAAVVCHTADRFSLLVEDATARYRMINQYSQQRNEADILTNQLERQNEQLLILKQAAEAASRTRTEFLAKVSHEIRTPLNALLGFAGILADTPLDDRQSTQVRNIQVAGNALSGLLNDILDLSRMESGKYEIEAAPFDLRQMLRDTMALCRAKAEEKQLDFVLIDEPALPAELIGDRVRLSQIVLNLLTNAIKFTESGHVHLRARCGEVSPASIQLVLEVEDTGRGVPLQQQQSIFERFSQSTLADATELGGVGLGLAIVRQLIEAMAGEISLDSEYGKGSTFRVSIPLKRVARDLENPLEDAGGAAEEAVRKAVVNVLDERRILLAEDDALNQQYASEILGSQGASVTVVETGAAAIQALLTEPVDMVFMDILMPEMQGDEAISRIRMDLLFPIKNTPIVTFSGKTGNAERSRLLQVGATGVLAKPYTATALINAAVAALDSVSYQSGVIDRRQSDDISPEMIEIFKSNVPGYLRELLAALFSQNEKQFIFQAHKLQSAMWVMELMDLYEVLNRLENEPLSFDERLALTSEVCDAVEALLSSG